MATCSSILALNIPRTKEPGIAAVHGVTKSCIQLSTHAHTHIHVLNIYNARSCKSHCEKVCKVSILIITDVCECRERMKARLEESKILRGGNLKEGFSEEGIFEFRFKNESKLVMEELKEDDSRHRKEQVLRGKGHL